MGGHNAAAEPGVPLLRAVKRGDIAEVQALLRQPTPVLEAHGMTALHAAALFNCAEAVPLLVAAGLDSARWVTPEAESGVLGCCSPLMAAVWMQDVSWRLPLSFTC